MLMRKPAANCATLHLAAWPGGAQRRLAGRHLREGGIAMSGLSSSRVEGSCCELAAFGH